MKELVIISGKGGTGKTSIAASFAALTKNSVFADCDVDAADLHLILQPEIKARNPFKGRDKAVIISERCTGCGLCLEHCRYDAILTEPEYQIDKIACEGCGVCQYICPEEAVEMEPFLSGEWYISQTRFGPLVHAKLGIAEENSGKLVSIVRMQAKLLAEHNNSDFIIVDGSPGVGCPVISSITGADMVLVITEPTVSGEHDLLRVVELTKYFKIPTGICINKWDINPSMAGKIEDNAGNLGIKALGKIGYDDSFTKAQIQAKSVVEYSKGVAAGEIRQLWENVMAGL